ncbi:hypothetical protein ACN38_g1106 [Penicillium nordicum]|uniref:Uncharacterized protein n=1 Tax=Penicillium nordicum TaxID=229535 RepID=A0A0M8PHS1_9EURO|nr:hypothetical protein ACN38_g1106 [Penicillium nordicum]
MITFKWKFVYAINVNVNVAHGMAETGPRGWIPGSTCIFPYWSDDFIPNNYFDEILLLRFKTDVYYTN